MLYFKNFMRISQSTKQKLNQLGVAPKESCRV
jgi:hypothetical protein